MVYMKTVMSKKIVVGWNAHTFGGTGPE